MDYYRELWYNKKEEVQNLKYLVMLDLEMDELKKFAQKEKVVEEYMDKLERLNKNPKFYQYMTQEEDERKIYNSRMYDAEQSGLKKGKIETATNFKKLGVDIETISKATGLSKEEIEKL